MLRPQLTDTRATQLSLDTDNLGEWDSRLMAFLLQCRNCCDQQDIKFDASALPDSAQRLLHIATTVPRHQRQGEPPRHWWQIGNPLALLRKTGRNVVQSVAFFGAVCIALGRLLGGRANTRFVDFWHFCYQTGPNAFAIISLTSLLVGMILAYLGAAQLQQFGAEIYVADLVVIGVLREMGVLMTAVVIAGRTGAAYAAQLGTMQANEEIDAIITMGISPIEFLVTPRILALLVMMPLLTIYANLLGILGGALVSAGMGISMLQYAGHASDAVSLTHIGIGLTKSVVFGALIAIAGCRAGIQSGRDSAAVGQAATQAVVTSLIYLIVADAAINILCQQLDI
ncbi:hypothetical protein CWI75_06055 [Kineobactrum sediminis]|uniref:ABC transporter permease n=2 Tax=Kineobactrum sediminis TaxID=1905677 RepID=A0A2N5Y4R3_9GAMM|nr:hypothetical protein CWI75_06055 [Kineobactrum sediminis]